MIGIRVFLVFKALKQQVHFLWNFIRRDNERKHRRKLRAGEERTQQTHPTNTLTWESERKCRSPKKSKSAHNKLKHEFEYFSLLKRVAKRVYTSR